MIAHYCAQYGREKLLSLLDEICSLDLMDDANNFNATPLDCACYQGHSEVCQYLIKKGCDPTQKNQVSLVIARVVSGKKSLEKKRVQ